MLLWRSEVKKVMQEATDGAMFLAFPKTTANEAIMNIFPILLPLKTIV